MAEKDLLSDLSDKILHNIISFLPKRDATKFTVLSKRLRLVFYSSPNIVYVVEDSCFMDNTPFDSKDLLTSLNQLIIHRSYDESANMVDVDKFLLFGSLLRSFREEKVESTNILNSAIVFAVQHNVKEFDFKCFTGYGNYMFPVEVFTSNSITVLNLEYAEVDSSILDSKMNLETLNIKRCTLPKYFKIVGSSIKQLSIKNNRGCKTIDIEASHLEDLCCKNQVEYCVISFKGCKNLKHLSLDLRKISDEWLASHLVGFPFLEVLQLNSCRGLSKIHINKMNHKLKQIEMTNQDQRRIKICVSNLESFVFRYGSIKSANIHLRSCVHLKIIRLYHVDVTDSWLEDNMLQFQFLEELKLININSLRNINISSRNNLKKIELFMLKLDSIKISTSSLESFVYTTNSEDSCDIDIAACTCLKLLRLSGTTITDSWLEYNMLQFSFLEKLTLTHCRVLKKIKIHGSHNLLKYLNLSSCSLLNDVEVNAQNLSLFTYEGQPPFRTMLIDSHVLHAKLKFEGFGCIPDDEYFQMMGKFLTFFDHCKVVELDFGKNILFVPSEFREILPPPLIDVRHLKVQMCDLRDLEKLVEILFWLSPRLDIVSFCPLYYGKRLNFKYATTIIKEDRPLNYFKHYLNAVSMNNFNDDEKNVLSSFFKREATSLNSISFEGKTSRLSHVV